MLRANNLVKRYGNLTVVDQVSLQIEQGEVVSISGASGAGKSTLLHLLGALDKPDSGSVVIDNTDIFGLSPRKQARFRNEKIGFVFQFHHLLPEFTAAENVAMPLWINGKSKNEGIKDATALLHMVGLGQRAGNKPSELSGGEQQRVAIARALVNKPSIVMADEPTGNLDSINAQSIHQLFLTLREELKQTFVIVTHNEELADLTDRNVIMLDGRIVETHENHHLKVT